MEFAGTYWGSCSAIFSFLCIFCRSWFFLFSYYPCIICPSSIDCFWLPLLLSSNLSCVWHGLCRQWWLESWLVHYQYIKNNKGPFKHQAQRFQYRTMFMSFNSNTTGVRSELKRIKYNRALSLHWVRPISKYIDVSIFFKLRSRSVGRIFSALSKSRLFIVELTFFSLLNIPKNMYVSWRSIFSNVVHYLGLLTDNK